MDGLEGRVIAKKPRQLQKREKWLKKREKRGRKMKGKKKVASGAQTQKTLHNAFHVHVVIRLRKGTQKKAIKITNERERREESDSQAEELL